MQKSGCGFSRRPLLGNLVNRGSPPLALGLSTSDWVRQDTKVIIVCYALYTNLSIPVTVKESCKEGGVQEVHPMQKGGSALKRILLVLAVTAMMVVMALPSAGAECGRTD